MVGLLIYILPMALQVFLLNFFVRMYVAQHHIFSERLLIRIVKCYVGGVGSSLVAFFISFPIALGEGEYAQLFMLLWFAIGIATFVIALSVYMHRQIKMPKLIAVYMVAGSLIPALLLGFGLLQIIPN